MIDEGELNIFDTSGRIVYRKNYKGPASFEISIGDLAAGIYRIQLHNSKRIYTGRFVKVN